MTFDGLVYDEPETITIVRVGNSCRLRFTLSDARDVWSPELYTVEHARRLRKRVEDEGLIFRETDAR